MIARLISALTFMLKTKVARVFNTKRVVNLRNFIFLARHLKKISFFLLERQQPYAFQIEDVWLKLSGLMELGIFTLFIS